MKVKSIFILGFAGALAIILAIIISDTQRSNEKVIPVIHTISDNGLTDDIWDDDTATDNESSASKSTIFPLDINTATAAELQLINGIGDTTSQSIIDYRNENGYINSLDELLNISGIGNVSIEKWKIYLCVIEVEALYYDDKSTSDTINTPEDIIISAFTNTDAYVSLPVTTSQSVTQQTIQNSSSDVQHELIDLNNATIEELITLNGVGPVTAEKIYNYAREKGFNSVDELINVNGIGEKKLENIRPFVCVK